MVGLPCSVFFYAEQQAGCLLSSMVFCHFSAFSLTAWTTKKKEKKISEQAVERDGERWKNGQQMP